MTLPDFDSILCAKCAYDGALTQYCDGSECTHVEGVEEHMHRQCKRCGYRWMEEVWREPAPRRRRRVEQDDDDEEADAPDW